MKTALRVTLLALWLAGGGAPAGAQHVGDVLVGRNASMQLIATGIPERTRFLAPVSSGPFHGWSGTSLGFDAVIAPDPLNDILPLAPGANIHIEVVSMDPGLSLRSFTAPAQVYADEPGERLRIGSTGNLHYHPIVFIDGTKLGSDFNGLRQARVRFLDTGSAAHGVSAVYLLTFAPPSTRLEFRRTGRDLEISFLAHVGLVYRIEFATSISGPWSALGDAIQGAGRRHAYVLQTDSDQRHFRAVTFIDN
ncbi:MAG: hypothetical protein JNL97_07980 [Verrucomicrobiales bacterium]|nr:hypothetical protein [Verrucomicrobiales bacterium]